MFINSRLFSYGRKLLVVSVAVSITATSCNAVFFYAENCCLCTWTPLPYSNAFVYRNFCIRRDFISNPRTLKKRLMVVGLTMLVLSPFIVIFMLVYLFLRHAEQFYNHPSTASSRRWSNLSRWILREYNEVIILFSFCLVN